MKPKVHKYQEAFTEGVIALGHQRKHDTLDITNLGGTWESLMRFKQPSKQCRKGSHMAWTLQKIRPWELKCMQLEDADFPLRDLSPNHLSMISAVSLWFPMILGLESEVTTQATYKGHKRLKVLQTHQFLNHWGPKIKAPPKQAIGLPKLAQHLNLSNVYIACSVLETAVWDGSKKFAESNLNSSSLK